MSIIEDFEFKFDEKGLICAIAQDITSGVVLMQAYMNKEALSKTFETGFTHYYSRSRNKLWKKGEESGHTQKVIEILYDCDMDCVLLKVEQTVAACHTDNFTCFYRSLNRFEDKADFTILNNVNKTILDRKANPVEGSYTNYLFDKGTDKICKKVGEEATETVVAAKNKDKNELAMEISDLCYHVLVLMANEGLTVNDIYQELAKREGKVPNPKYSKCKE